MPLQLLLPKAGGDAKSFPACPPGSGRKAGRDARSHGSRRLKSYRIALLAANPVPYHIAFYRALARHPSIELTVYYCSRHGLSKSRDAEFGIPLVWDDPNRLLEGYDYRFLRNLSPLRSGSFWSVVNPGILPALFRRHYDAVIIPGYACASFLMGFLAARLSGTPVFLRGETLLRPSSHWSPKGLAKKTLLRILLKRTWACFPIGTPSRLFYRAHQVPEERTFFSPYSVDNDFFERESRRWKKRRLELKHSLGIDPSTPVILFCGKLAPRKRPLDLLSAFLQLEHPAALLFVGEGSLRPSIERQASGRKDVFLTGFVGQQELPKYYALADLFVLPSEHEVAPLVVHEAMACGLPVILSDAIPSRVDFVVPGENGFIYPMGDVAALRGHLEKLLEDEPLRRRMGERSASLIQAWTPEAGVDGVLQALRSPR